MAWAGPDDTASQSILIERCIAIWLNCNRNDAVPGALPGRGGAGDAGCGGLFVFVPGPVKFEAPVAEEDD